jgi:hypothetical protein
MIPLAIGRSIAVFVRGYLDPHRDRWNETVMAVLSMSRKGYELSRDVMKLKRSSYVAGLPEVSA